jgi:hypothetical protein
MPVKNMSDRARCNKQRLEEGNMQHNLFPNMVQNDLDVDRWMDDGGSISGVRHSDAKRRAPYYGERNLKCSMNSPNEPSSKQANEPVAVKQQMVETSRPNVNRITPQVVNIDSG